jgi:hypothetical protein
MEFEKEYEPCPMLFVTYESEATDISDITDCSVSVEFISAPVKTKTVIDLTGSSLDSETEVSHDQVNMFMKNGHYNGNVNTTGEKHGFGIFKYTSGNIYEGHFRNDQRHGHGYFKQTSRYVMCEGRLATGIYTGSWKNDFKDGYGKYIFSNGDVYEGYFCKGSMHGMGLMTEANGLKHKGNWRKGKYIGKGKTSTQKPTVSNMSTTLRRFSHVKDSVESSKRYCDTISRSQGRSVSYDGILSCWEYKN